MFAKPGAPSLASFLAKPADIELSAYSPTEHSNV